ncbi:MAG: hypothetical protein LUE87_09685 [Lachnospiraceae bacterium]|nr:hypothetical protein [Lachnospiraceae bacterium]
MTQKRLYKLAYEGALQIWGTEHDRLEARPESRIAQARERKAWEELEYITSQWASYEKAAARA